MIFVFGSNLKGRHGKGAALEALQKHGAIYGQGIGMQGNSYAIPTKDGAYPTMNVLPLHEVEKYIIQFLDFAYANPYSDFNLTPIGCGLAGYKKIEILTILRKHNIPDNVYLNKRWIQE